MSTRLDYVVLELEHFSVVLVAVISTTLYQRVLLALCSNYLMGIEE